MLAEGIRYYCDWVFVLSFILTPFMHLFFWIRWWICSILSPSPLPSPHPQASNFLWIWNVPIMNTEGNVWIINPTPQSLFPCFFFLVLRKYSFVSRFVRNDLKSLNFLHSIIWQHPSHLQTIWSWFYICKQVLIPKVNKGWVSEKSLRLPDFWSFPFRSTEVENFKFWGRGGKSRGKINQGKSWFSKKHYMVGC